MIKKTFTIYLLFLLSFLSQAEPSILSVDKSIKPKSSTKKISSVHQEIKVKADNIHSVKYAILEGMLTTHGYKWVFEGEGDGYVLARFDYRGDTNIIRIEYTQQLIQLKYHQAWGDFVCKNLVDDICYKNSRGYYKYFRNLRNSIVKQVTALEENL